MKTLMFFVFLFFPPHQDLLNIPVYSFLMASLFLYESIDYSHLCMICHSAVIVWIEFVCVCFSETKGVFILKITIIVLGIKLFSRNICLPPVL